ncbi:E3 ubiquitin-protein ligase RGLG2-like protein isoform X1 [Cinnamomum micranthum f. kanehirae]|uniref:E3 ubiquitin-protein ligase RGLG2-like protein isoform X1 n=1 Tax=Cinnamomum micranthum f. kanehirae TaxID=337451 RepID=A0A443Q1U9_9MAGN|nr:E3 ubiquitin-protein ligase RGLG2-like protein isoform X1 [Cinnamomum micranthum f. kanehirae]
MLALSPPILLSVLISQRAMSGQVRNHLTTGACITSGIFRIPMNKQFLLLGTLSAFDEDNLIPCFGFGDVFYPDERQCRGFEEALKRYREIVPHLRLADQHRSPLSLTWQLPFDYPLSIILVGVGDGPWT